MYIFFRLLVTNIAGILFSERNRGDKGGAGSRQKPSRPFYPNPGWETVAPGKVRNKILPPPLPPRLRPPKGGCCGIS